MKANYSTSLKQYNLSGTPETTSNTHPTPVDFPSDREVMIIVAKAHAARSAYVASRINRFFSTVTNELTAWNRRRTACKHLATLDDRLLDDIGVKRASIDIVIGSPIRTELANVKMMHNGAKPLAPNVKVYHRPTPHPAMPFSGATSHNTNVVRTWFMALRRAA